MTMEDASSLFNVAKAEREIMSDPTLSLWGKTKALGALQAAAAKPEATYEASVSVGDVAKAAVGAGLGYGAGTIMGKMLGASPGTLQTFKNYGMGLGTLLNLGVTMKKTSNEIDRRNAFRLGFVKAALDLGLVKEAIHGVVPITPEMVTGPINALLGGSAAAASTTGSLLGQVVGTDGTDLEMQKMQLEQRGLEEQEQKIRALRNSQAIKKVLDARRMAGR